MKRLLVFGVVAPLALVTMSVQPATGSLRSHSAPGAPVLSGVLFHNVDPTFAVSKSERHQLAVVAVGAVSDPLPGQGYRVPFVVRNGTTQTMGTLQGYATIWSPQGQLVASGSDQGFDPTWLLPGQESFAYIYVEPGTKVPAGSIAKVSVGGWPLTNLNTFFTDLKVVSAKVAGRQLVGAARNPRTDTIQGPGGVTIYCVSAGGRFLGPPLTNVPMIPTAGLAGGADVGFTVNLSGLSCPSFVVGASAVDLRDLWN